MKVYLASAYGRREELLEYVPRLALIGWESTANWVNGNERGLTRADIAKLDYADIDRADAIMIFTEPYGTMIKRGGKMTEFGYAVAKGKRAIVIGDRENVFMNHPDVIVYSSLDEFIRDHEVLQD